MLYFATEILGRGGNRQKREKERHVLDLSMVHVPFYKKHEEGIRQKLRNIVRLSFKQ